MRTVCSRNVVLWTVVVLPCLWHVGHCGQDDAEIVVSKMQAITTELGGAGVFPETTPLIPRIDETVSSVAPDGDGSPEEGQRLRSIRTELTPEEIKKLAKLIKYVGNNVPGGEADHGFFKRHKIRLGVDGGGKLWGIYIYFYLAERIENHFNIGTTGWIQNPLACSYLRARGDVFDDGNVRATRTCYLTEPWLQRILNEELDFWLNRFLPTVCKKPKTRLGCEE